MPAAVDWIEQILEIRYHNGERQRVRVEGLFGADSVEALLHDDVIDVLTEDGRAIRIIAGAVSSITTIATLRANSAERVHGSS